MADEFLGTARQVLAAQPFSALLGLRLDALALGQVTMALPIQPVHTQQDGWVHDGVLGTLTATALLFAGGSALGQPAILAEYKINFVQPARGVELRARAQATVTTGNRQALGRCEVWARAAGHEALVAVGQGTIVLCSEGGV